MGLANFPVVTDGSDPTTGTVFNAAYSAAVQASIENDVTSSANPTVKAKNTTDEVVSARNGSVNLLTQIQKIITDAAAATAARTPKISSSTTPASNVGIGSDDTLFTYTVAAGLLAANGDYLKFESSGSFAATANVKTIKVWFGATSITLTAAAHNNLKWKVRTEIYRKTGTTQYMVGTIMVGTTVVAIVEATPAETLSGTVVLKITGADATAAGGVTGNASHYEKY